MKTNIQTIVSFNPFTDEELGSVICDSKESINQKIQVLKSGFNSWSNKSLKERIKVVAKINDALTIKKQEIANLITREIGRPITESLISVDMVISRTNYFLNVAENALKDEVCKLDGKTTNYLSYEPLGVVAVISGWNYPLNIPLWSIVPALLAGNTILFKASELSPLCGKIITEVMRAADIGKDIFALISGGVEQGKAIVDSDVDMISFTGCYTSGREIYKGSANSLRKLILELGGNDCMVVLSDADIDDSVSNLVWGFTKNSGQACNAVRKVFLPKTLKNEFTKKLLDKVSAIKCGDPLDTNTKIGPIKDKKQIKAVKKLILENEERLVFGGEISSNVLTPTIIDADLDVVSKLNDEYFAPLVFLTGYDAVEDVLNTINSYDSGLTCSIWTSDIDKGAELAKQIDCFTVGINKLGGSVDQCPWGGRKKSGLSFLLSEKGIREFAKMKNTRIRLA
jgi:succinate-semialdehyde dehydrogenase / glutarate-semialdehyde dehydrogenase